VEEDKFITVKEITTKSGTKGEYISVKATDDSVYNIFDTALFKVFEIGRAVRLKGKMNGKYFNTSFAEQMKDAIPPVVKEAIKEGATIETEGKAVKETTIGKNRSFALSYAKDIAVALISTGDVEKMTEKTITCAKRFEKYLDAGE